MSAQERTFDQYHQWMKINAASHLIRAAGELGLLEQLRQGQQTLPQLCQSLSLQPEPARLLVEGLVAMGVIENYEDDYALAQAAQLLCQYDQDLGDHRWSSLVDQVRGKRDRQSIDDRQQFDYLAATQWVHTPAAMQAAEILDIGGEGETPGPRILDLGCGSAVWSCAMAHRDRHATITAIDHGAALQAATSTAHSIGLNDRWRTIEGDPSDVEIPEPAFDISLIAQRLTCLDSTQGRQLASRAVKAIRPGGRLVVIDLFRGPTRPNLADAVEGLKVNLSTRGGRILSIDETKEMFDSLGLQRVQFAFLAASKVSLGMAVGEVPPE